MFLFADTVLLDAVLLSNLVHSFRMTAQFLKYAHLQGLLPLERKDDEEVPKEWKQILVYTITSVLII